MAGWLEPRLKGVPEVLRARILEAVAGEGALPSVLQEAGERLLAEAVAMPASRETAVTLLAADALMTFACEAAADLDYRS